MACITPRRNSCKINECDSCKSKNDENKRCNDRYNDRCNDVKQNLTHYSIRGDEMRTIYAACEIGSTIKIVTSKGFADEQ